MRKVISIICFFTVLLASISCTKDAVDFDGQWELITAPVTGFDYFWSFKETDNKAGSVTVYTTDTLSNESDTCSSGDFFVKNNVIT
ncbi:MAG: hypothetical protein ACJAZ2_001947, partial [Glaciecola sp.]